ncbi:MAG TPA: mannosyltransferase family protein [Anaerolineales bacterium]
MDDTGQAGWQERLRQARWLWLPTLAFAITRLGVALVAYLAGALLADAPGDTYHIAPDHLLLDVFTSRWDTGFYLSIASEGYRYQGVPLPSVAFFPLLPLLIRAFTAFIQNPLVAGLLVTNAALLGASILLYRYAALDWGEPVADRAVWYLLIFPVSFFGSAIYSESLFLLVAVGSLYLARKGYWESAAMLGILASLTRFVGLILAPTLLAEWLRQRWSRPAEARPPLAGLLAPVVVPAGTLAYMAYLNRAFGDPLAFLNASAAWARVPRSPLVTFAEQLMPPAGGWGVALLSGRFPLDNWIDLLAVLFFLSLGCILLMQRRWSEGVFVVLGALLPFSSGLLMSQRRYMWVLFPAFILLARWGERPWVDRLVISLSLLGLGLFTAMFANWYWVG